MQHSSTELTLKTGLPHVGDRIYRLLVPRMEPSERLAQCGFRHESLRMR